MKAVELRAKSKDELEQSLLELRREQFNFRFQTASGKIDDTSRVRVVRRDIARVKTILNEQKSGVVPAVKAAKPAKPAAKPAVKKKAKE